MADTTTEQQEKSWLSEFFDKVKDDLSWLWNKIKEWINNIFWKEIFEVTTQTKKDLKKLEDDILKIDDSKLNDNEINESIEWKIDDKNTILWLLVDKNQDIKNRFNWLNDIWDEGIISQEIENILLMVKKLSNNDSNSSKWDLTETELTQIWTFAKKKHDLCESVLKCEDDNFKNLSDDLKTKKEIINSFNTVLREQGWDINKVTVDLIITKLEQENNNNN